MHQLLREREPTHGVLVGPRTEHISSAEGKKEGRRRTHLDIDAALPSTVNNTTRYNAVPQK